MISRYLIHPAAPSDAVKVCTPVHHACHAEHALFLNDDIDASYPIYFRIVAEHQEADQRLQLWLGSPDYSIKNIHIPHLIFYKTKITIPSTFLDRIIVWYHAILNHSGVDRTYKTISQYFYAHDMEARVFTLVRRCSCKKISA